MEQRYEEPGSLELNWRVRRFLPGLPEEGDDRPVQEILEAQDFVSDAAVRQYWSVPERLLDLRWLSERPVPAALRMKTLFRGRISLITA